MQTKTLLAATAFLTILIVPAASASTLTFNFTGTLDLASPNGNIPGDLDTSQFGSTITGSWSVDDGPSNNYNPFYFTSSFDGTAGSYAFTSGLSLGYNYEIVEHDVVDAISVDATEVTGASVGPYTLYGVTLTLAAPAGTFLSSTALPASLPSASAFTAFNQLDISFTGGSGGADVIYTITNLTSNSSAVPEPSTWALGIAGLGLAAWRKRGWRRA